MRAAGLVRRIGTNLNQATAKLKATGQPAGDLPRYAAGTIRRAGHIDEVAEITDPVGATAAVIDGRLIAALGGELAPRRLLSLPVGGSVLPTCPSI